MNVFIFRRDFRIYDNTAFIAAYQHCVSKDEVLYPIFIFTPEQITKENEYRSLPAIKFMIESLEDLAKSIPITFFYGKPANIVKIIQNTYDTQVNVWLNEDYTPYSETRDESIKKATKGVFCPSEGDPVVAPPGTVRTLAGNQYSKFTPYYKSHLEKDTPIADKIRVSETKMKKFDSKKLAKYILELHGDKLQTIISDVDLVNPIIGGRKHGMKILKRVENGEFDDYENTRDILSISTTRLGAYLKFGCISPREALAVMEKVPELARQIIWRDFYYQTPVVMESTKEKYKNIDWVNDKDIFSAWCEGRTGYPVVDAAMRQLNQTGFMHNRGRLIVASFLTKNLQIDWRWGEKYFAQRLIDYDPIVNAGNWMFVVGSSAYSQPYFRVYNPVLQAEKHDKSAEYIKRWVPELTELPPEHLHDWEKFHKEHTDIDYPSPIVEYKKSKEDGLSMYKAAFN